MEPPTDIPQHESLFEFVDRVIPQFDSVTDIDGWNEENRQAEDAAVILVRLDPVTAEMTRDEFLNAVNNSDEESVFEGLVEFYPRESDSELTTEFAPRSGDGVIRVTGTRVEDPPRYYADKASGIAFLHGKYSRSNWVVGQYQDGLFDDRGEQYLQEYRLFTSDGVNRAEEIHRANSIIDWIRSDEFNDVMRELSELSEEEREEFFEQLED